MTRQTHRVSNTDADLQQRLLDTVRALRHELHPDSDDSEVQLDAALERELGFDSLSRAELLARLEREFHIGLSEQQLASAETPRDLLRAVTRAAPQLAQKRERSPPAAAPANRPEARAAPHEATTLTGVLDWHVQTQPERVQLYLYDEDADPQPISYQALRDGALAIAAGLLAHGVKPGQTVAIMLPTGRDYLGCFFGILYAGAIPVPIYPPARPSQLEEHLQRHAGILANAAAVLLITMSEARSLARLLKSRVQTLDTIVTPDDLHREPATLLPPITSQDIAFIQYTSGSTDQPKGVVLRHADLLANIRAMGHAIRADSTDVFVSWLPLYHDMGLIGAWLGSLYYAMTLILMSPLTFLSRPQRWLWAVHHHRGTISAGPNFAYELCLSRIPDEALAGLDLGSLRLLFSGAEPVSPQTVRRFNQRFGHYGLHPTTLAPVYGLAEAAVGLAFPPLGRGPLIDRIERDIFMQQHRAQPAAGDDAKALEYVACGQPLPGYELRVVDDSSRELPERQQGRLQFRGPSATSGYYRNPEATRALFDDTWLETGDLAYIAGGDVYLTSRIKDVIIRGGRNIYPYETEHAIGELEGVRKGCVAIFGSVDPESGTERLVVMAETRLTDSAARADLQTRIRHTSHDLLGMPPDNVVLAPPRTILKTSSGKIRRPATRELYEQGRIGDKPRPVWWQIARLISASLLPETRRIGRSLRQLMYAAYGQLLFWLLAPVIWTLVVILPRESWRWAVMRRGARLLLRLAGVPLQVHGTERLAGDGARVIVANHASYLDGIVLVATLDRPFSFIAKRELQSQWLAGLFLKRIGTRFVERFDKQKGMLDARRIAELAGRGRSLLFFPEGTLRRMPGLMAFHMGAFAAAAQADIPVLPITLRGTRSILRGDTWFPRHGAVSVLIGEPIAPDGSDWAAAVRLRDTARNRILKQLGEPDLAGELS
ncbi:AMP-binding protein [Thiohalophilus thiocyanatoxydans]|uniref:1-acyl-sn-glycerol-3-phosphate acyltransferase n=1 Tax=Thiohalophilus thiocyanatoxydans TaxID=381308 RepID=A0A4R8IPI2_9GAMM|nr:AMP-binding protein [Thiohalophilus thiocyanatoxydans]TDX99308.1 1-acyl-sn-glycerol-3-phosphate acyltransferase [Thiohalophilus thiocyanatoxydans]